MTQAQDKVRRELEERVLQEMTLDWEGIAWLRGQQRKSSVLGMVHTSHCHLRAPWAGLSLLGCSQHPELSEVDCISWSQGCGRFQACESNYTKERGSEVEAGVAAERLSFTGETDLLELGPDLVTVTEHLGREVIPAGSAST